ncbi:MAG: HEPN domain-containing protein [Nitrospirae bacterium]|nr:HEPN domain-containing protein [Nitrospirota bacterium]
MSKEKDKKKATLWLETAISDIDTAKLLSNNSRFAHSCFFSHQAVEKAVKALWYFNDEEPWGHSILKLIADLKYVNADIYEKLKYFLKGAKYLDKHYIPTRYPNGLPDITPDMAYDEDDARTCIDRAEDILRVIKEILT